MNVKDFGGKENLFFDAFAQSDLLGKGIFFALFAVSIVAWVVLIYKIWLTQKAARNSARFYRDFQKQKQQILHCTPRSSHSLNPFNSIYSVLKKHAQEILNKNRQFGLDEEGIYLSSSDIEFVEANMAACVSSMAKQLEKNLFILATVVGLAPLLGLLGTVWGILTTFSEMTSQASGTSHSTMLNGLAVALTTTVLGLITAIPALMGYNYLKNTIHEFTDDMRQFAIECLAYLERQYRKVELGS